MYIQFERLRLWTTLALMVLPFLATTGRADAVPNPEDGDTAAGDLVFVPFDPFLPCGDGSPAGFYRDATTASSSNDHHVMVFLGGYACATKEDCAKVWEESPQKLSSAVWPRSLEGGSLLSRNATENPVTADGFSRWLVPYCSQDLYLGTSGSGNATDDDDRAKEATGFFMAGDAIFEAALQQWRTEILDAGAAVETLVVAGVSAGAIAVMNHAGSIQRTAAATNTSKLRVVLDASDIGSQQAGDGLERARQAVEVFGSIVDFEKHPLCNVAHTYPDLQAHGKLWNVPCCMSVHCMLENDPDLRKWTHDDDDAHNNRDDRLLLLDSVYDPLGVLGSTRFLAEDAGLTVSDAESVSFGLVETAGSRRQQILQSAYGTTSRLGPKVLWAVSNAAIHTHLLVAPAMDTIRCDNPKNDGEAKDETDAAAASVEDLVSFVCRDDGYGYRVDLGYGLPATAWNSQRTWELAMVNDEPVRSIIRRFVHDDDHDDTGSENPNANPLHGLIWDACNGPNCVPSGATERHPIMELFEIENDLVNISPAARLLMLCALGCLSLLYVMRLVPVKLKPGRVHEVEAAATSGDDPEQAEVCHEGGHDNDIGIESANNEKNEATWDTIVLKNISVKVEKTDKELLKNISFKIVPGTITGLFGPSGAGKTTLFNLLCGHLPSGMKGFKQNCEFEFLGIKTSYLRQFGNSSFQNIELDKYLRITARLYGVSETELANAVSFLNRTFSDSVEKRADFGGIRINQLSGGQQRIVAIIATLFTKPQLLLLDEPLSGLDSVSSIHVLRLLRELVAEISCSIILSIHQPSDAILEQTDNLFVLKGGVLVLNESFKDISKRGQGPAELIHGLLENKKQQQRDDTKKSVLMSLRRGISLASFRTQSNLGSTRWNTSKRTQSMIGSTRWNTSERQPVASRPGSSKTSFDLWQIQPLIRRMHLETGFQPFLIAECPIGFLLATILFQFDDGPFQVLFVSSIFCIGPALVYQPLLFDACAMYQAHLLELEDGRISPTAFFLASFLVMFSMPIVTLAVAVAIGYAVLGWNFDTYVDQYLFAALFLMVSLQSGRCLLIHVNGHIPTCNHVYTLVAAFNGLFCGAIISPNKVPMYIRWIFYVSTGFWSSSGISLVHFENGTLFDAGDPCSSLVSCLLQDGAFLGRVFGYTPISTSRLAYRVLLGCLAAFFVLEYAMMYRKHGAKRRLD